MISRSNPNLTRKTASLGSSKPTGKPPTKTCYQQKEINEKGDADAIRSVRVELPKNLPPVKQNVRRQLSAPALPTFPPNKHIKPGSAPHIEAVGDNTTLDIVSLSYKVQGSDTSTPVTPVLPAENSLSLESNVSTGPEPICEALEKDPKLKALCTTLGISPSRSTMVGPIEKGQLIIATLQDSLQDLIRKKMKAAWRKRDKFNIQQSGLEYAVRALRNAERSLKTIKDSKQPVLGRARQQRSSESLLQNNRKTTESVIRILNGTKEKFDKMDNGMNRFLSGISLVSSLSVSAASSSPPWSTGISGYGTTSRLTTPSIMTTPVNHSSITTACSRAKTALSSTSLRGGYQQGMRQPKMIPINS